MELFWLYTTYLIVAKLAAYGLNFNGLELIPSYFKGRQKSEMS